MIVRVGKEASKDLAKIHIEGLKNDFLPSLGENFLKNFYQNLSQVKGVVIFGEKVSGKLVGFIIGTNDMKSLFKKVLKQNFLSLSISLSLALLKKPILIFKVIETFLYPSKDSGPKAELVVISILKKFQGKGIGKRLVNSLEKEFKKSKIKKYKLTVHADKKAVKFYEKLKYIKKGNFIMYGKEWLIYEKSI